MSRWTCSKCEINNICNEFRSVRVRQLSLQEVFLPNHPSVWAAVMDDQRSVNPLSTLLDVEEEGNKCSTPASLTGLVVSNRGRGSSINVGVRQKLCVDHRVSRRRHR